MVSNRTEGGTAWAGWVIFASTMLVVVGTFNLIQGLVAIFDDERLVIVANKLIAVDLTGWGWLTLIFGVVMIITGFGLLTVRTWARITAIVIVALHALAQMSSLGAYPVWSLLMITLDTVLLYALTVRWSAASASLDPFEAMGESRASQHSVR